MSAAETKERSTWRQVAVVADGKNVPVGRGALLTVDGPEYTVTYNGKLYQKGTSKAYLDRTPYHSDVFVTEGPGAGQTLLQIFKVEGDVLIACIAAPGAPRPTEFTSEPGSNWTLSVWLRVRSNEVSAVPAAGWQVGLLVILFWFLSGSGGNLKKDLEPTLGYWGTIVASGLVGAAVVLIISLLLKWGWRIGLVLGLSMSTAINTFEELRKTLEPTLGPPGAVLVSASTACIAGLAVGGMLTWLLGAGSAKV